jgi:hypothetical protein
MTGQISLLPHPFVEERMQQFCEGARFHSDPRVFCSVAAPFFRKRSLASWSTSGVMLVPESGVKTAISNLDRLQAMDLAQDVLGQMV